MQSREMIFLAFESKQILNTTMYINVQYVKYTKKLCFGKFFTVPCILLKESRQCTCTVVCMHNILFWILENEITFG